MKSALLIAGIGLLTLINGGCGVFREPYMPTDYFDLPQAKARGIVEIIVDTINNATAAKQRMLYRTDQGRVLVDEYNRWIQSPDQMLFRYLSAATPHTPEPNDWYLRAVLTAFSIDWVKSECVIGLNYELTSHRSGGTDIMRSGKLRVSAPFSERTPEAYAAAFAICADKLADDLIDAVSK